MAEFLQTSYLSVAFHALLPALLFYLSVGVGIHFYALKHQYEGLSRAELPGWQATLKTSGFFLIPGAILLFWLIRGYTPQYAAFWAIISTLPFAFLTESWRPDFEHVFEKLETAALKGARQMAFIAIICASAQIIIAVTAFTGIGVKVSSVILGLSQNSLLLALLLTAFITILLGMEVPTTAAYTIAAVSCAAVLEGLHLPLLTAHMFIFYLAILSAITPPVCGAVFIAAGLADAPWFETAKYSLKLAFVAFLLPFLFVYDQSLLLVGSPLSITLAIGRSILAVVALSAGLMGYWGKAVCSRFGQGILFGAGVLLIIPRLWTDIAGIAIIALYSLYVYRLQTRP